MLRIVEEMELNRACDRVRSVLTTKLDVAYFGQEARCRRNMRRITELLPRGATILDIGSHFLHQGALLSLLGYKVVGIDVGAFAGVETIRRRASEFDIENVAVDRFDHGDFLRGRDDAFDFVVFTEIQEHITFNPVKFWRRVYELMRIGGRIYITTPNGVRLWQVASTIKRAALSQGIGIPIQSILGEVTFGHHWKEYSAAEIRELFARLSPDFEVQISYYQLRPFEAWRGIKSIARDLTRRISNAIPPLREEMEAVVTLTQRSAWTAIPPEFF